jgi:hypothetical protein
MLEAVKTKYRDDCFLTLRSVIAFAAMGLVSIMNEHKDQS